jgi:hypothetical protein
MRETIAAGLVPGNLRPMASLTEPQAAPPALEKTEEPLLVFVHIPKSAGTTFGWILRCHYGERFDRIDQSRRGKLETAVASARPDDELPDPVRPGIRAVSGHLCFGLSSLFPEDTRYVTILRDPVERTISQYEYLLSRVGHPWHNPQLPPPTAELRLDQSIGEANYIRDNLQTRMLCGLVSQDEPLPADAIERAKRNLQDRFEYVGTTERFAKFVAMLNLELGWPTIAYQEARVTPGRRRKDELPADVLRVVEDQNALDRELVDYADELLTAALEQVGPELELETEVLRRALPPARAARRREPAADALDVRALPIEARVALALQEAELARARKLATKKERRAELLEAEVARRSARIAELKAALGRLTGPER